MRFEASKCAVQSRHIPLACQANVDLHPCLSCNYIGPCTAANQTRIDRDAMAKVGEAGHFFNLSCKLDNRAMTTLKIDNRCEPPCRVL